MLNEYKKHLQEQSRLLTERIAGAFKLTEEKRQEMENNHLQEKLKKLNYCLRNGIVDENEVRQKVSCIVKLDGIYYFVTNSGLYACDKVLDYFIY